MPRTEQYEAAVEIRGALVSIDQTLERIAEALESLVRLGAEVADLQYPKGPSD
jgi:hypothetical protein